MTTTNRPIVVIHNVSTGEIVEREMNDAEFTQYEIDQENNSLLKLTTKGSN